MSPVEGWLMKHLQYSSHIFIVFFKKRSPVMYTHRDQGVYTSLLSFFLHTYWKDQENSKYKSLSGGFRDCESSTSCEMWNLLTSYHVLAIQWIHKVTPGSGMLEGHYPKQTDTVLILPIMPKYKEVVLYISSLSRNLLYSVLMKEKT